MRSPTPVACTTAARTPRHRLRDGHIRASRSSGGECGSNPQPYWKGLGNPVGSKGYQYENSLQAAGGLTTLVLNPGDAGGSRITVTGKKENLLLPPLPLAEPPALRVLLESSIGFCAEASYSLPITNSATTAASSG